MTTTTHHIITGFGGTHHCLNCAYESFSADAMLGHADLVEWPDAISWDDLQDRMFNPELEDRDECNVCGRTEYMCPGH